MAARITARLPALDGKFGLDDVFILIAWLLTFGFTICLVMLSYSGLGQDVWTLPFHQITETLKIFTALEKLYIPTVWITKISILLLYLRLFPDTTMRLHVKICMAFCAASLFSLFWACVFKCWPISLSWNYWDGEHKGFCTSMAGQGWANSGLNMFADIVVLLLPLPTIWKLKLNAEKKYSIMAMFSVGLLSVSITLEFCCANMFLSVTVVSMVRLKTMKYFTFTANPTCKHIPDPSVLLTILIPMQGTLSSFPFGQLSRSTSASCVPACLACAPSIHASSEAGNGRRQARARLITMVMAIVVPDSLGVQTVHSGRVG